MDIFFFEGVESSHVFGEPRPILRRAVEFCLKDPRRVLVVESRTRLIRHCGNYGEDDTEMPTAEEYEKLVKMLKGVRVCTLLHPDSKEERKEEIMRGREEKGKKGGRPKKEKEASKNSGKESAKAEVPPRGEGKATADQYEFVRVFFDKGFNDEEIAPLVSDWCDKEIGSEAVRKIRSNKLKLKKNRAWKERRAERLGKKPR